jgi:anti-anti-sigma factor
MTQLQPLAAEIRDEGAVRLLVVREENLEHERSDAFRSFLENAVADSSIDLILELPQIQHISSLALGLISLASVMAEKKKLQFVVVCSREEVLKLFVISGLYKAVKISNTVESARLKLGHPLAART